MARFVDANVFLYAYLKPRRALKPHEIEAKNKAKEIVQRIDRGEEVFLSASHLSEVANVLEDLMPLEQALEILEALLQKENIRIIEVSKSDYLSALEVARRRLVGLNDALAYVLMKKLGVSEIYSFDKHFDLFPDVRRIC